MGSYPAEVEPRTFVAQPAWTLAMDYYDSVSNCYTGCRALCMHVITRIYHETHTCTSKDYYRCFYPTLDLHESGFLL